MRTTLIQRQVSSQGLVACHTCLVFLEPYGRKCSTHQLQHHPEVGLVQTSLILFTTFRLFYKSQRTLHSCIQLSFLLSTSLWLLLINDLWKCTQSLIGLYTESFCHQVHTLFFYWHHDLAPVAVMGMSQNLIHANYYFQQSESHQSKKNTVAPPGCLQFRQYFDTPQQST